MGYEWNKVNIGQASLWLGQVRVRFRGFVGQNRTVTRCCFGCGLVSVRSFRCVEGSLRLLSLMKLEIRRGFCKVWFEDSYKPYDMPMSHKRVKRFL